MTITKLTLKESGLSPEDAKNTMQKIFDVGARRKDIKAIMVVTRKGKEEHHIVWKPSAMIDEAIERLSEYVAKPAYSKRVKTEKWIKTISLLKKIKSSI